MKEQDLKHGAVFTPKNPDVVLLKNVAGDSAPFDWALGVDVTRAVGELPTKNQSSSFSCGGQAGSYFDGVASALANALTYKEKSAHFVYALAAAPGGGSTDTELMRVLTNFGDCDEILLPSYTPDHQVPESFISDKTKINAVAYANASLSKFGTPLYVKRNLEDIAKAVRDHGGVIIGVIGQNNGTWLGADPKPPVDGNNLWYHWLYVGRAVTRIGLQEIGAKQSWGEPIGEKGWQYFGNDYMPYLFTAFTFAEFNPKPNFKHTFNVDMKLGDKGNEVKALQDALKIDGTFPKDQLSTGYFGQITLQAVKSFQTKYGIKPVLGNVFALTRAELNKLYS